MRVSGLVAAAVAGGMVAACAPKVPLEDMRATLAKSYVEVKVDKSDKITRIITRTQQAGQSVLTGHGLMGALIGSAIIAAGAEDPIPMRQGASAEIAAQLRAKVIRKKPANAPAYDLALSDAFTLLPAPGFGDYMLNYTVQLKVVDVAEKKAVTDDICNSDSVERMTIEAWRAAPDVIERVRVRAVEACGKRFVAKLTP